MFFCLHKSGHERKEAQMEEQEARKLRLDLTAEEKGRPVRFGSLDFNSIRRPDMRVEKFIPSREQH
jgi:hypothetical protein